MVAMVRKSKEADREYMRVYMRDRRAKEKAAEAAQIEKIKLGYAENILVYEYLSDSSKRKGANSVAYRIHDVTGVTATWRLKPSLKKRVLKLGGIKITALPSVPDNWVPYVKSVVERAKKRISVIDEGSKHFFAPATITVSEPRVIQDFKRLMAHDLNELINEEWLAHFKFLSDRWHKLPDGSERDKAIAEWKQMVREQRASEEALTDFILEAIVDKKTDDQILRETQFNEKIQPFYKCHFAPQFQVKKMIKEIRGYLP